MSGKRGTEGSAESVQTSALTFQNVSFSYSAAREHVVESLSFSVSKGTFVSIVGPSGCGKSTIFRLIVGLEAPQQGQILLDGSPQQERLGHVGYMPQQDLLLPWRTVLQNIELPLELKGVPKRERQQKLAPLIRDFGLQGTEAYYPGQLSGGMRQRASFLRASLISQSVLLLDEPFSALDAITRLHMQEWLLEKWQEWKTTVLFITHDVDEALFLSDQVFMIQEQPVRRMDMIDVPLGRPRHYADLSDPDVVRVKHGLLERLKTKVNV